VPEFPRASIAIKLVWYPVHRDRRTQLPIWDGEPMHPDDHGNPDRTWRRTVTIAATDAAAGTKRAGAVATKPGTEPVAVMPQTRADTDAGDAGDAGDAAHEVPITAFLHHALETPAELASARAVAHDPSLALGDFVVLLGMHVTTKEIPDWVWATFWWHDRPDDGPFAADRPAQLDGAARNYLMDVAYSAESPARLRRRAARLDEPVARGPVLRRTALQLYDLSPARSLRRR
jgi:hypothetical protein